MPSNRGLFAMLARLGRIAVASLSALVLVTSAGAQVIDAGDPVTPEERYDAYVGSSSLIVLGRIVHVGETSMTLGSGPKYRPRTHDIRVEPVEVLKGRVPGRSISLLLTFTTPPEIVDSLKAIVASTDRLCLIHASGSSAGLIVQFGGRFGLGRGPVRIRSLSDSRLASVRSAIERESIPRLVMESELIVLATPTGQYERRAGEADRAAYQEFKVDSVLYGNLRRSTILIGSAIGPPDAKATSICFLRRGEQDRFVLVHVASAAIAARTRLGGLDHERIAEVVRWVPGKAASASVRGSKGKR